MSFSLRTGLALSIVNRHLKPNKESHKEQILSHKLEKTMCQPTRSCDQNTNSSCLICMQVIRKWVVVSVPPGNSVPKYSWWLRYSSVFDTQINMQTETKLPPGTPTYHISRSTIATWHSCSPHTSKQICHLALLFSPYLISFCHLALLFSTYLISCLPPGTPVYWNPQSVAATWRSCGH